MKRKALLRTKRMMAVIIAASLFMSSGIIAFADSNPVAGVSGTNVTGTTGSAETVKVEASDIDQDNENDTVETVIEKDISDGGLTVKSVDGSKSSSSDNDGNTVADVTVKGDVTNNEGTGWNESAVRAEAVSTSSTGSSANTKVRVEGDASAGNITGGSETNAGVVAKSEANGSNSEAHTEVTVKGEVSANGTAQVAGVYAASTSSYDANADHNRTAYTEVTVEKNVKTSVPKSGSSIGIHVISEAESNEKMTSTVTVKGDVSATSENGAFSKGIYAQLDGKGAVANVTVVGNVNSTSSGTNDSNMGGQVAGIDVQDKGGEVNIEVGGDVTADTKGFAFGINGVAGDADVNIKVGRDVTANGNNGGEAIQIIADKSFNVDVGRSVKQTGTGEEAVAINIKDDAGTSYRTYDQESTETPSIKVTVAEDVTSDGKAILVDKTKEESTIDVTVGGTVSGKEHNIVLGSDTGTDKLEITVWKVDTSNEKNVVDTYDNGNKYTRNTKAEEKINYIIKVGSNDIKLEGTTKVNDYDTAHEGNKVYLKVDIPAGYTAEFKDVNGNSNYQIVPDGEGGAYLVVPRGGGVYVGVNLMKSDTATSGDNSGSTNDSTNNSPAGSPTDNSSTNTQTDSRTSYSSPSDSSSGGSGGGSDSSSSSAPGSPASAPQTYTEKLNDVVSALASMGIDTTNLFFVQSVDAFGNTISSDISSVLTPVDRLTAINNFMEKNAPTMGLDNFKGAGVVSLSSYFTGSATDTVSVPVVSDVVSGQTYTVVFSDGTTMTVPCSMNGVLNIPFTKSAEGLTFIIYGTSLDPSLAMQQLMQQPVG